ncbi:uncharacterized protein LOC123428995 [Hordeum vulgare subsp. vulgare]|uniref:uncharacterized protein LOC123428995 n=1 Tax=Hordeum vulgare subsp. vulgare TaxID=112509 RepID=UPI001D1A3EDF|nr:uncharacterized protein LOC123428995 [Hordeum vulgare subsp. vulgare]
MLVCEALVGGRRRRGPCSRARALERWERARALERWERARALERWERVVARRKAVRVQERSRWRGACARRRCYGGCRPLQRAAELGAPRSGPRGPALARVNHSAPTHPSPSSHPSQPPPVVAAGLCTRAVTLTVAAMLCHGESRRRRLRAGAVQVIVVACWTRSRWWPACWRCAGRCPNLRLPTFLGFPLHVLPSSPTFFDMSGLHLHLRSLLMGRGKIPAQRRPALSTATPEGAVTSLEALA